MKHTNTYNIHRHHRDRSLCMYLTLITHKYKPKLTNESPHSNFKKYVHMYHTHVHRGKHTTPTVNTETIVKFNMK